VNVSSIDIEVDIEFVFIIASRQVRWLHSVICDAHPIIAVAVTITITITFLPQTDDNDISWRNDNKVKRKEMKRKEKKRKPEQMGNRTASRKKSEKKRKITFNLFHISLCVPPA